MYIQLFASVILFNCLIFNFSKKKKHTKRIRVKMLLHYLYIYWSDNKAILFVSTSDWPQSELGIGSTCLMFNSLNAHKTLYYISALAFVQLWEFKLRSRTEKRIWETKEGNKYTGTGTHEIARNSNVVWTGIRVTLQRNGGGERQSADFRTQFNVRKNMQSTQWRLIS
jgi:hypothetical protein